MECGGNAYIGSNSVDTHVRILVRDKLISLVSTTDP